MSVSIRLARQGSKKRPFYRIVASDRRSPRDGRFIEQIGSYDPRVRAFNMDFLRYAHWMGHGARASDTVASLVRKHARESK